jgi:hypothetical protein
LGGCAYDNIEMPLEERGVRKISPDYQLRTHTAKSSGAWVVPIATNIDLGWAQNRAQSPDLIAFRFGHSVIGAEPKSMSCKPFYRCLTRFNPHLVLISRRATRLRLKHGRRARAGSALREIGLGFESFRSEAFQCALSLVEKVLDVCMGLLGFQGKQES